MSKNMNFNEQPPLPPKLLNKIAPPLPPKHKISNCIKVEDAKLFPRKVKSSKELMRNNNSYTLPNLGNQLIVGSEKPVEQKERYGNYETKTEKPMSKKNVFFNKIRKLLKKSKKSSQSEISEDFMKKVSVLDENKYNDISNEICNRNCSNIVTWRQCSSCCYRFCYCHHTSKSTSCFNSDRLNHFNKFTSLCEPHCNISSFDLVRSEMSTNSNQVPILPNRTNRESIVNNQLEFKQKPKLPEPPRLPQLERYSNYVLNKNFTELEKIGWYWGSISLTDSERLLENKVNGTFLMRDSSHNDHPFTVTFRVNYMTYHARIKFIENKFFWTHNNNGGYNSITELIVNSLDMSKLGLFRFLESTENPNPLNISLLYPFSRFNVVSSLKHLCRFIIITNVRYEHLNWLRLPSHLLSYLNDKEHHYVENFDRFVTITDSNSEQNSSEL